MDCTNVISMIVNSKGGQFTNRALGTDGADIEPSALLTRAVLMVSGEMGRFQPPHIGKGK
jgi:hypothetical protein